MTEKGDKTKFSNVRIFLYMSNDLDLGFERQAKTRF